MRRIWASPELHFDWAKPHWGEGPNVDKVKSIGLHQCAVSTVIKDDKLEGFAVLHPQPKDFQKFWQFRLYLEEAKRRSVAGSMADWNKFLEQSDVKRAEREVVDSDSFRTQPIYLDKSFDQGDRHDYVLYNDFLWTLDEDCRFGYDNLPRLQARLIQECTKLTNGDQPLSDQLSTPTPSIRPKISEAVRHEVWRRDQGRCIKCGSRERLEFDHIVPVTMGGSSTTRNIELLCESCNRQKGASF